MTLQKDGSHFNWDCPRVNFVFKKKRFLFDIFIKLELFYVFTRSDGVFLDPSDESAQSDSRLSA